MDPWSGKSIGRYHIIAPLGEGGMAVVYKAFDTRLESYVAVKFIRKERVPPEALDQMLQRFEREAKALARLTHPNIVKVIDFGSHEDWPYLVMPFLPSGTLKQHLGEPIPYPRAARLLAPVARALAYAHGLGILHRDVKPANILITESGEPMLADFGIAKIFDTSGGYTLTGTGVGIGTPEYMAPEQWLNLVTPQTDIYALGVVFYEMVVGRKPYNADTPAAILLMQAHDPLPRPSQFNASLPETIEKILFKVLAKQPEDRYATMGEFAAVLEKLSAGILPGQSDDQSPEERAVALPVATPSEATTQEVVSPTLYLPVEEPSESAPLDQRIKSHPSQAAYSKEVPKTAHRGTVLAVVGVLVVLAILAMSFWVWQKRKDQASALLVTPTPSLYTADANRICHASSDQHKNGDFTDCY